MRTGRGNCDPQDSRGCLLVFLFLVITINSCNNYGPIKTRCNYLRLLRNEDLGFQIKQVTQMSLNTSGKCRNSRKGGRRLLGWTSLMSSNPAETIQTAIFSINPFKKYPCIHGRDYPFPSVDSWLLYCKLIDHIFTGLFLGLYSVPLMNVSVFMSYEPASITLALKYSLKCDASSLVLISQNYFGYWESSVSPYVF